MMMVRRWRAMKMSITGEQFADGCNGEPDKNYSKKKTTINILFLYIFKCINEMEFNFLI